MTYDTIENGESTPLQIPEGTSVAPSSTKNKHTSSIIVRALMVGTTVGALLLMAGHSKMTTMNKTSNVDGMVVVSSTVKCTPATGTFSGLSCKNNKSFCAGPGGSFSQRGNRKDFETCYVSNNPSPNDRCWSHSHTVCAGLGCHLYYDRCDPLGYNDGDKGYDEYGIWHVSAPHSDGSCGYPCREFI